MEYTNRKIMPFAQRSDYFNMSDFVGNGVF
ncbi:hypothetical protein VSAK1_26070 [Vibrio mediterranei AK1]|nr:hypothetical protein VSAK1_26070 [Vibrio mediterranei AK1]